MAKTNGDILKAQADAAGIALRTLDQVRADIAQDEKRDPAIAMAMARLMLKAGRLTDDARAYVEGYVFDRVVR